ncbi:ADP-L-glycero-D-manno-heptose-6-epimerase (plasmid) [Streptomyces xanthophaeus]|nr:NAD-dependent epimerase/dehydratase family protein [Streptomyces xanthophaeus]WCD91156.1 ADP-L-glycero-D-manno-heptose-6-epimerase [Streptomyces xanthophaeus]
MKIVITGGAGFIGSALTQALRIGGHTVTPVDNLSRPPLFNRARNFSAPPRRG